jgi:hypothetical protein
MRYALLALMIFSLIANAGEYVWVGKPDPARVGETPDARALEAGRDLLAAQHIPVLRFRTGKGGAPGAAPGESQNLIDGYLIPSGNLPEARSLGYLPVPAAFRARSRGGH